MPHPNETLINQFYSAFQRRDAEAMAACYHPQLTFNDPVFVNLKGERAGQMWKMLCERGTDLKIVFNNVQADDQTGSADWEATYTFSRSGRKVVNKIHASFRFKDGKMIDHRDQFNFWRWSRQTLGLPGLLLGWTPFFQKRVQEQSMVLLEKYIAANR